MRDYLFIGPSPCGEDCVQVSAHVDYVDAMRTETRRFRDLLTRAFPPVDGARFVVKTESHDFGPYMEVAIAFDDNDETACNWAFKHECASPETWEELEAIANRVSPLETPV